MKQTTADARLDPAAQISIDAHAIPGLSHREATALARIELDRVLRLLQDLEPEDWSKPTACSRWSVREIVAHLVAFADAYSDFAEFRRQGSSRAAQRYRKAGLGRLDAMNQIGVDDRANLTPRQVIAQLQERGPRAIRTRDRLPAALRHLLLPLGKITPELGHIWLPIGYLTDTVLTRDMWMHRLDVSRATGKEMLLTSEHDGRITALVVRDLARALAPKLSTGVVFTLTGPAGGSWRIGRETRATVHVDALTFHLLASGRLPLQEVRTHVSIEGDAGVAERALESTSAPY